MLLAGLVYGLQFGHAMRPAVDPLALEAVGRPAEDLKPATMPWWGLALAPPSECGPISGLPHRGHARNVHPRLSQVTQMLASIAVIATGYSSSVEETDDTPTITADNRSVRYGMVALSRDLLREFTPGAPFGFGDEVEIRGLGRFVVADTMSRRHSGRVDIWFPSREEALAWGVRRVHLVRG